MNKWLFFLILFFLSCKSNNVKDSATSDSNLINQNKEISNSNILSSVIYSLKNDSIHIDVSFTKIDSLNVDFNFTIYNQNRVESIKGIASLIRLQNEDGSYYIPEGTAILDENNKQDYFCDSTYSYESEKISVGFGLEKKKGNRLSLTIDNSKMEIFKDHNYTLYKKQNSKTKNI